MRNVFILLKAFQRKNNIDVIKQEKQSLEDIVFDALEHRYELNRVQRTEVLKNVVEKWKERSIEIEASKKLKHLEAEEANDVAKSITMYGLTE